MFLFILGVIEEVLIKLDMLITIHRHIWRIGLIVFLLSLFNCLVVQSLAIDPTNRLLALSYSLGATLGAMITVKIYWLLNHWTRRRRARLALIKARQVRWADYRDFKEYENGRIETGNIEEGQ